MDIDFVDPKAPRQQAVGPGTGNLSRHSREHLDAVAAELNSRSRKTLGWESPAERLQHLMSPRTLRLQRAFRAVPLAPDQVVQLTS